MITLIQDETDWVPSYHPARRIRDTTFPYDPRSHGRQNQPGKTWVSTTPITTQSAIRNPKSKSRLASPNLRLNSLPNPYPVPNRPFSLDFIARQSNLPKANVDRCLEYALITLIYIVGSGHPPVPSHVKIPYGGITFNVDPVSSPYQPDLTYNDTIAILEAFVLKTKVEGYKEWIAEARWDIGGRYLGDALLVYDNGLDA